MASSTPTELAITSHSSACQAAFATGPASAASSEGANCFTSANGFELMEDPIVHLNEPIAAAGQGAIVRGH